MVLRLQNLKIHSDQDDCDYTFNALVDFEIDIELLYKDCYQRMLTVARLMLKNDDEASDTVSDVFARLAEGSLKMPDDHPDRYLMVIVRNRCLDRIRVMTLRERIERRLSLSDTEPAFGEREQEHVAEIIDYAERTFSKQTWNVFQLRFSDY